MKRIEFLEFPETSDEFAKWEPYIRNVALSRRVLACVKTRIEGAWGAYIDAVEGKDHGAERGAVLMFGDKLPEKIARILFPEIPEILPYIH